MKCVLGFVGMLLIAAASYGVRLVHAETKSKMRTLHFGPVTPPAPGEEFDMRRWLKSAMPTREDRCPSKGQEEPTTVTYSDEPVKQTTTEDIDTACVTFKAESGNPITYPTRGRFDSRLRRFEFSVVRTARSYHNISDIVTRLDLILMGPTNQTVCIMSFTDLSCVIVSGYLLTSHTDTHVDCNLGGGSGRYWVEVTDDKIQLGKHGNDTGVLMASSIEIWSIKLMSQSGDSFNMTIYAPCY